MIIVDRFEGDFAVCEADGRMLDIRRELLSEDVRPGDVIVSDGGIYRKSLSETQERKNRISALMDKIRQKK